MQWLIAMAEKSKKRGEFGEDIVERLLSMIGWRSLLIGRDFDCMRPIEHTISTKGRSSHGVDFIYKYECLLFNNRQQFVLISSKFNDTYPSNPVSRFKSHLCDIAYALECFKKSSLRNQLAEFGKEYKYTGVIFWLDNGKTTLYDDVIERLTDFRVRDDLDFESVYLVDNKRAEFLHNTIVCTEQFFDDKVIEFLIPNTGYNSTVQARKTSSSILPVQYINSSILPLKVIQQKHEEILVLNVIDAFEEDYLKRLISLAQKLTEGWANKVYIWFPEFNQDIHGEIVKKVQLDFRDQAFINKIAVGTFNPGFRNV